MIRSLSVTCSAGDFAVNMAPRVTRIKIREFIMSLHWNQTWVVYKNWKQSKLDYDVTPGQHAINHAHKFTFSNRLWDYKFLSLLTESEVVAKIGLFLAFIYYCLVLNELIFKFSVGNLALSLWPISSGISSSEFIACWAYRETFGFFRAKSHAEINILFTKWWNMQFVHPE